MGKINAIKEKIKKIWADNSRSYARSPRKFALKDWKNAFLQTKNAFGSKRISILAAGVAYFLTFSIFPAIAAGVAIISLVVSREQLSHAMEALRVFLPTDIANLIASQLNAALNAPNSSLLIGVVGVLIALFSVSGAITNSISATNAVYETTETRKFFELRLISTIFITLAAFVGVCVVSLLLLNETFLMYIGIPSWLTWTILILRWIVIASLVTISLAVFYRYAPDRKNPHWQWVTWGSVIATILWLLSTTVFFIYVRYFAHYTEAYSVFAGIIILMIWLNLTAFSVLLGAEINFRLENQTRAKTTK